MKFTFILSCFLLSLTVSSQAQDLNLDSLVAYIEIAEQDTILYDAYITISQYQAGYENDETVAYGIKAKELAELLNDPPKVALALKWIGIGYYYQSDPLAIDFFGQAYVAYEALNDKSGMANMLQLQGETNTTQGDGNRGLELQLQALTLIKQVDDKQREASILVGIGNAYAEKEESIDEAISYYKQAFPIFEEGEQQYETGNVLQNLGDAYYLKGEYKSAFDYYNESLEAYDGREEMASKLVAIGRVYTKQKNFDRAITTFGQAISISEATEVPLDMAKAYIGLGETYKDMGDNQNSVDNYLAAIPLVESDDEAVADYKTELEKAYAGLAIAYARLGKYDEAYKYQFELTGVKEALHESDNKKTMDLTNANFVNEQQKAELAVNEATLQTQRLQRNAFFGGFVFVFAIAFIIYRNYRNKAKTNKILDKQNAQIDTLLLNILPEQVARELQHDGYATPRNYTSATVLFTDFKGFTTISAGLEPRELIAELNSYFNEFDNIIEHHGLEKIKTIGDAYMCAGGIPSRNETHPLDAVEAGLEMQAYIRRKNDEREIKGLVPWELRIGIHTGPIVAGVVGRKKYAYDIWGDTVNIASRMESNGEAYEVNISEATYELVKHKYTCVDRGKIEVKGAGEKHMYFVKPNIDKDLTANEATEVEALK